MNPNLNFALSSIFDHVHRYMKPVTKPNVIDKPERNSTFIEDTINMKSATVKDTEYDGVLSDMVEITAPSNRRYQRVPTSITKSQITKGTQRRVKPNIAPIANEPPAYTAPRFTNTPNRSAPPIHAVIRRPAKTKGMKSANIIAAPAIVDPTQSPKANADYSYSSVQTPKFQTPTKPVQKFIKKRVGPAVKPLQQSMVSVLADEAQKSNVSSIRVTEVLKLRKSLEDMLSEFYKLKDERESIGRDLMVLRQTLKTLNVNLDNSFQRLNLTKNADNKFKRAVKKSAKVRLLNKSPMQSPNQKQQHNNDLEQPAPISH